MRRRDDLGPPGRLPHPIHKNVQGIGMQAVVDLLDDGEIRRIRVVESGEEREHAHRAEGGVGELDRPAQSILVELRDNHVGVPSTSLETDGVETRQALPQITNEFPEDVRGCVVDLLKRG